MTVSIGRKALFLASALLAATAARAQQPPQPQQQQRPDFSKVEIKTIPLADNFYALEGQGGTISVLTGPDGVLLVDSQFAPLTEKLVAAIRQVSDKPIRFLVNTHVHGDHVGGNENFAKLGAVIFARQQLRERLRHPLPAADGTLGKPAVAEALPVVTYDDPVTIHLDGENVRLLPIRAAHTDGDTLVSFPEHDILAVGDYFRSVGYPIVDLNNGGSLNGLLEALRITIERAGPNTKIIPGHGPTVGRDAVIAQRDLLIAYRDKVAVLVGQNKTLEEVLAAKITAPTDAQIPQSEQTAERFVKWLYAEVKAAKLKAS
jgi:glyoxylase-like metal-dependent hydrolase (beta-lactamase superfamily II)